MTLIALGVLGTGTGAPAQEPKGESIYRRLLRSTALVMTPTSSGSAWVVDRDRGLLVTNYHVAVNATSWVGPAELDLSELGIKRGDPARRHTLHEKILVAFPVYRADRVIAESRYYQQNLAELRREGRVVPARVLDADIRRDLAVLAVEALPVDATAVPLAADSPEPGTRIHAIGNPDGSDSFWLYRQGVVRQVAHKDFCTHAGLLFLDHDARMVETQGADWHGDSGGPIVNDQGDLVAVTQSGGGSNPSLNFSVDVTEVRDYLGEVSWMARPRTAAEFSRRAAHYLRRGRLIDALNDCDEAIRLQPDEATFYLDRAAVRRECGHIPKSKAVDDCDQAIRLRPDLARAHAERGATVAAGKADFRPGLMSQLRSRDLGLAPAREDCTLPRGEADCKTALRLDPGCSLAYQALAQIDHEQGENTRAIADATAAIRLLPGDVDALLDRSLISRALGDLDRALADVDAAIRLRPRAIYLHWARASFLAARKDDARCVEEETVMINLRPEDPALWEKRGLTCLNLGQPDQAIVDFTKALAIRHELRLGGTIFDHEHRGDAYAAKGQGDPARKDYETAIALIKDLSKATPSFLRDSLSLDAYHIQLIEGKLRALPPP